MVKYGYAIEKGHFKAGTIVMVIQDNGTKGAPLLVPPEQPEVSPTHTTVHTAGPDSALGSSSWSLLPMGLPLP